MNISKSDRLAQDFMRHPKPKGHMSKERPNLKPVNKNFIDHLHPGDRLFHYPRKGNAEQSFAQSPSAEYTLFSVIDLPTEDDVVLLRAFDKEEEKQQFSRSALLAGDWWYIEET